MKLGLTIGYSGPRIELDLNLIRKAEDLGYWAVWTSEAYGSDAVTPLAWAGAHTTRIRLGTAIMQIPGRTPANTAMTAMTLDQLSGGRMILGLGASGPQVVEGWHGLPYGKPLRRTREYVDILRRIFAREEPLAYQGEYYNIPCQGPEASGMGKPLKSIIHGRADLPIYLAAIGPKNIQLCAEIADGWFPFILSPYRFELFEKELAAGFARSSSADKSADFVIAPLGMVEVGEDVQACRNAVKPLLALYIGGMGVPGRNFYNNLVRRYGYEEAADKIQSLFLQGKKAEAMMAVPDELVDEVALCGPPERIAERLEPWRKIPNLVLNVPLKDELTLETMARLAL
ncbi:MAG: LLM class F420-dependent oxidoreductase [Deltaproteobacteria bacterium]|nr:LLM class F420-dependent oxidoreductase [Deltaproteobacteria bacterium]